MIRGKKYRLVPEDNKIDENGTDEDILDHYNVSKKPLEAVSEPLVNEGVDTVNKANSGKAVVERAKPEVYDYRRRFKEGKLLLSDIKASPRRRTIPRDRDISKSDGGTGNFIRRKYGYDPWFGPGTQGDGF